MNDPETDWNRNDCAASFRRFAEGLKEHAQAVFRKDKTHVELFFLLDDDGQGEVVMADPKMKREEMVETLKGRIREQHIYGVVHIAEGWTYFPPKPTDHTLKQIMAGEIAVSELRCEDRGEALVVTMESRDGAHFMWVTPILREGGKVELGKTLTFPEMPGGRFVGLFA